PRTDDPHRAHKYCVPGDPTADDEAAQRPPGVRRHRGVRPTRQERRTVSDVTLLLLRIGFLVLLWFFVFAVVYSLRADLFGVRARRLPDAAEAGSQPAPQSQPAAAAPAAPQVVPPGV